MFLDAVRVAIIAPFLQSSHQEDKIIPTKGALVKVLNLLFDVNFRHHLRLNLHDLPASFSGPCL
jgi:hypothetical protein